MDTAVVVLSPSPSSSALVTRELVTSARAFAEAATSAATRRAYQTAWRAFTAWCADHAAEPLPAAPEAVALYLTHLAEHGRTVASVDLALAAIAAAHRHAGLESPRSAAVVRAVARGIRRTLGVAPTQKAPVTVPALRAMLAALPAGRLGVRDRALLLVGFASALRRAELVALTLEDVRYTDDGAVLTVRRSKTDQEGAGRVIGVPFGSTPATCPVRALKAWTAAAGLTSGPIFRGVNRHGQVGGRLSARGVARVVQRAAAAVGLEAATFGGHSLRAGFATSAALAGKSERAIMAQTGHQSVTIARRYIRQASVFTENAAAGLL